MRKRFLLIISILVLAKFTLLLYAYDFSNSHASDIDITWGEWSEEKINKLLKDSASIDSKVDRIDYISEKFLGTSYKENTLTGSSEQNEVLTVNFDGMDCFTYLDYVEALSISDNFKGFLKNLRNVRYKESLVDYKKRRHFFSDWLDNNDIADVTGQTAPEKVETVLKNLNKKTDTSFYLQNIPVVKRHISYIPSERIDTEAINNLYNGDYIGIFTIAPGLDVSHTGILIKKEGNTFFRHASSKKSYMKVVDEDFLAYIKKTPGILVYRSLK